mmetsp:Transcript_9281/g.17390  ORF Transcript_9281/g.17390 Transcript_9281/m.17390 type:complete len:210 (-) Transcript_9281:1042-1671(-)
MRNGPSSANVASKFLNGCCTNPIAFPSPPSPPPAPPFTRCAWITCSKAPDFTLKQQTVPSAARQKAYSALGDTASPRNSEPSPFWPDTKDRTTCPCGVIRNAVDERPATRIWPDPGRGIARRMATSAPLGEENGGLKAWTHSQVLGLQIRTVPSLPALTTLANGAPSGESTEKKETSFTKLPCPRISFSRRPERRPWIRIDPSNEALRI